MEKIAAKVFSEQVGYCGIVFGIFIHVFREILSLMMNKDLMQVTIVTIV